jgi:hypothetical protein
MALLVLLHQPATTLHFSWATLLPLLLPPPLGPPMNTYCYRIKLFIDVMFDILTKLSVRVEEGYVHDRLI